MMKNAKVKPAKGKKLQRRNSTAVFHLMLIPGVLVALLFTYLPLLGNVIAFMDFSPIKGFFKSDWVGWENFRFIFAMPNFIHALRNTIVISVAKIILNILVPVTIALLMNEMTNERHKRCIQTMVYMPHFLSWIILAGIFIDMLSPSNGIINSILGAFGIKPIYFLGDTKWFPIVIVLSDVWKSFGWGTIVYLAALTGVDPNLYEAAMMDGASRWKQTIHVTLPSIMPIIVLMTVLAVGNVLNAGFDQVYNMLSASVYETGDIIDTFVYRLGMLQRQYSPAAAVGLFKSVVSFVLVSVSYWLADKFAGYRVF